MKLTTSIMMALFLTMLSYSATYGASANGQGGLTPQAKKALELRKQRIRRQNEIKKRNQLLQRQNKIKKRNQLLQRQNEIKKRNQLLQRQNEIKKRNQQLNELRKRLREKARRKEQEKTKPPKVIHRYSCTSAGSGKTSASPACKTPTNTNQPRP